MSTQAKGGKGESKPSRGRRKRGKMILGIFVVLAAVVVGTRITIPLMSPLPDHINYESPDLSAHSKKPNFVSSRVDDENHHIEPLDATFDEAMAALEKMPRAKLVHEGEGYAHFVAHTPVWGFRDDVQLLEVDGTLHIKSSSRIGHGDLRTNRRRVEELRAALAKDDGGAAPSQDPP